MVYSEEQNNKSLEQTSGLQNEKLWAFEEKFANELTTTRDAILAYRHAFGILGTSPAVRTNVWKLGAPEVHRGGHSAKVWIESRQDEGGRPMEVLIIENGYNPSPDFSQRDIFEFSFGATEAPTKFVGLKATVTEPGGSISEFRTLIPEITPDRLGEMIDFVKQ